MRKSICYKITISLAVFLGGCSGELNVFPEDAISVAELSRKDVAVLEAGVYENLKDAFIPFYILDFDVYGENFEFNEINPSPLQVIRAEDAALLDIWSGLYAAIFNANVLLEVASRYSGDDINRALATGYFVRAFAYYNLVTRFGGVPLLPKNTNQPVARSTENETWDFILSDLNRSLQVAPGLSSPLFVSKYAVSAMLARVYLAVGNMEMAAAWAGDVMESGKFSLEHNYADVFIKDGGSELIFGLSNFQGDLEIWRGANATDFSPPGGAGFTPSRYVFDHLFEKEDSIRKRVTFIEFNGQRMLNKYSTNQTLPFLVTRLSEMYLIRSEALGLAGGGLDVLNAFRRARGLSLLTAATEADFERQVALERRRELYSEGFLFYDLVRTGTAVEQLEFVTRESQTKLPIPQQEVDLGGLTQNAR